MGTVNLLCLQNWLSTGGSYIIENFAGSGLPVIIQVTAINTGISPGHADITISSATPAPTLHQHCFSVPWMLNAHH
jgi:hypothetical protein